MRAGVTEHANRTKDNSRSPNLMDLIAMAMDEVQVDSFLLLFLQLGDLCVSRWLIYRAMTLQLHWKHSNETSVFLMKLYFMQVNNRPLFFILAQL
jgi:hypothetical protein